MATLYNLELTIKGTPGIPTKLYDGTVRCFDAAGLLGTFRVNEFGRMRPGFEPRCERILHAQFDIMYSTEQRTARELVTHAALTTSGSDDKGMEAVELGEHCVELLEHHDPFVDMPFAMYRNMPLIPSMELRTPCGLQSLHAHKPNADHIRFWRPAKDKFIYDSDAFKNYVFDLHVFEFTLATPEYSGTLAERLCDYIQRIRYPMKERLQLGNAAIQSPDSVDRIPW